jgi:ribonuclease P protein component
MPGITRAQRLRSPRDFAAVRAQGRSIRGAALILGWRATGMVHTQFGFVVSKRVGNAVTRNRIKRRLRAALQQRLDHIAPGIAIVFTAKPSAAEYSFAALEHEALSLLQRAKLWREVPAGDEPASIPHSDPQGRDHP